MKKTLIVWLVLFLVAMSSIVYKGYRYTHPLSEPQYHYGRYVLFSNDGPYGMMCPEMVTQTIRMNLHSPLDWVSMVLVSLFYTGIPIMLWKECK